MAQTKKSSLLEVSLNVGTGYFLALATQAVVFPWLGIEVSLWEGAGLAGIFTAISILRGYVFRRVFNHFSEEPSLEEELNFQRDLQILELDGQGREW